MSKREKVMRGSLRNERTGEGPGSFAGFLLNALADAKKGQEVSLTFEADDSSGLRRQVTVHFKLDKLKGGLASLVTQRPNRPIEATARPKKAGRK